jgi:hypothetical protein
MTMNASRWVWAGLFLLGTALGGPVAAQVEVSPRIAVVDGDDINSLAGIRGRLAGSIVTPYAGAYLRATEIKIESEPGPSGWGFHGVLGIHIEGGGPGSSRTHAALGAGVVAWHDDPRGEEVLGELEVGLTFPTSGSFGILLAFRMERLDDRGTSAGGTVGVAWRIGG